MHNITSAVAKFSGFLGFHKKEASVQQSASVRYMGHALTVLLPAAQIGAEVYMMWSGGGTCSKIHELLFAYGVFAATYFGDVAIFTIHNYFFPKPANEGNKNGQPDRAISNSDSGSRKWETRTPTAKKTTRTQQGEEEKLHQFSSSENTVPLIAATVNGLAGIALCAWKLTSCHLL